jgi:hypothetical protein
MSTYLVVSISKKHNIRIHCISSDYNKAIYTYGSVIINYPSYLTQLVSINGTYSDIDGFKISNGDRFVSQIHHNNISISNRNNTNNRNNIIEKIFSGLQSRL